MTFKKRVMPCKLIGLTCLKKKKKRGDEVAVDLADSLFVLLNAFLEISLTRNSWKKEDRIPYVGRELGKIRNKHQDLVASLCNERRLALGFCWCLCQYCWYSAVWTAWKREWVLRWSSYLDDAKIVDVLQIKPKCEALEKSSERLNGY